MTQITLNLTFDTVKRDGYEVCNLHCLDGTVHAFKFLDGVLVGIDLVKSADVNQDYAARDQHYAKQEAIRKTMERRRSNNPNIQNYPASLLGSTGEASTAKGSDVNEECEHPRTFKYFTYGYTCKKCRRTEEQA